MLVSIASHRGVTVWCVHYIIYSSQQIWCGWYGYNTAIVGRMWIALCEVPRSPLIATVLFTDSCLPHTPIPNRMVAPRRKGSYLLFPQTQCSEDRGCPLCVSWMSRVQFFLLSGPLQMSWDHRATATLTTWRETSTSWSTCSTMRTWIPEPP